MGEATCQRCGGPNIAWSAPSAEWNGLVGTEADPRGEGLILCPVCYGTLDPDAVWLMIRRREPGRAGDG